MGRLIDACEVHAEIQRMICSNRYNKSVDALTDVLKILYDAPTIDAEPVRHGRWIWLEPYGALLTHRRKCSECGEIKAQEATNFCPNCGAEMDIDGGENNAAD